MRNYSLLCLLVILCFVSNCDSNLKGKTEEQKLFSLISVCQLVHNASEYSQKDITVEGKVEGFHYLIMYDSNCKPKEVAILIWMDKNLRKDFIQKVREELGEKSFQNGNYKLNAILKGKLKNIDYENSANDCFVPDKNVLNPEIKLCLAVSSITKIQDF